MRPWGWALVQSDWCPYRKWMLGHTETSGMQEHWKETRFLTTARRPPSANQGDRSQKKPNPPTAWSWTFSLHNSEELNIWCLSHQVCGRDISTLTGSTLIADVTVLISFPRQFSSFYLCTCNELPCYHFTFMVHESPHFLTINMNSRIFYSTLRFVKNFHVYDLTPSHSLIG